MLAGFSGIIKSTSAIWLLTGRCLATTIICGALEDGGSGGGWVAGIAGIGGCEARMQLLVQAQHVNSTPGVTGNKNATLLLKRTGRTQNQGLLYSLAYSTYTPSRGGTYHTLRHKKAIL